MLFPHSFIFEFFYFRILLFQHSIVSAFFCFSISVFTFLLFSHSSLFPHSFLLSRPTGRHPVRLPGVQTERNSTPRAAYITQTPTSRSRRRPPERSAPDSADDSRSRQRRKFRLCRPTTDSPHSPQTSASIRRMQNTRLPKCSFYAEFIAMIEKMC